MERLTDLPDLDLDFEAHDPVGLGEPPEPPVAEPPRRIPAPRGDGWAVSALLVGIVLVLSMLKLALFAVGGAAEAVAVGVVFVIAHGAALAIGACWFWPHRYA